MKTEVYWLPDITWPALKASAKEKIINRIAYRTQFRDDIFVWIYETSSPWVFRISHVHAPLHLATAQSLKFMSLYLSFSVRPLCFTRTNRTVELTILISVHFYLKIHDKFLQRSFCPLFTYTFTNSSCAVPITGLTENWNCWVSWTEHMVLSSGLGLNPNRDFLLRFRNITHSFQIACFQVPPHLRSLMS
jgi:hypothetical protein